MTNSTLPTPRLGRLVAREWPLRRPRTTQMARTVSLPSLLSRWGVDDGKVIESPGPRANSSNPTTTRSVPLRTYPNSWPLWRASAASGLDAPPGAYVASMNSTSSSAQNISRSHVTPELRVIVGRPIARCTASPGPAADGENSDTDGDASSATGAAWSKSTSSTVTPNSDTNAYNVRTEGCILPVSICEIELGERSSLRASSRRLSPRRRRIARSRGPSADDASEPLSDEGLPFIIRTTSATGSL